MDYTKKAAGIELEIEVKKVNAHIVDRLIDYRKKLHMTQQDIADLSGMKRTNISRIENKKHAVTLESLVKYAACLNLELQLILREQ